MLIRGSGICLLALLAFSLFVPAFAQSGPPDGYAETLRWYHQRAEAGDARAQFLLGVKYETGTDVRKDTQLAANWFEKAARQGLSDAQFKYALALQNGRGRPVDPERAREWYTAAAAQGFAPAQFNLGVMLLNGARTEDAAVAAVAWIMRAERGGVGPARDLVRKLTGIYAAPVVDAAQRKSREPLPASSGSR